VFPDLASHTGSASRCITCAFKCIDPNDDLGLAICMGLCEGVRIILVGIKTLLNICVLLDLSPVFELEH